MNKCHHTIWQTEQQQLICSARPSPSRASSSTTLGRGTRAPPAHSIESSQSTAPTLFRVWHTPPWSCCPWYGATTTPRLRAPGQEVLLLQRYQHPTMVSWDTRPFQLPWVLPTHDGLETAGPWYRAPPTTAEDHTFWRCIQQVHISYKNLRPCSQILWASESSKHHLWSHSISDPLPPLTRWPQHTAITSHVSTTAVTTF